MTHPHSKTLLLQTGYLDERGTYTNTPFDTLANTPFVPPSLKTIAINRPDISMKEAQELLQEEHKNTMARKKKKDAELAAFNASSSSLLRAAEQGLVGAAAEQGLVGFDAGPMPLLQPHHQHQQQLLQHQPQLQPPPHQLMQQPQQQAQQQQVQQQQQLQQQQIMHSPLAAAMALPGSGGGGGGGGGSSASVPIQLPVPAQVRLNQSVSLFLCQ